MGIFDWLSALAKGDEEKAEKAIGSEQLAGGVKETATVDGLDFVAAIEAHRKWKKRLVDYADGNSTEKLDPTVICRDDQCILGKWIYTEGNTFVGHLPTFHKLKAKHASFHISAGEIVELVKQKKNTEALEAIQSGDFSNHSRDVQTMLSQLYMALKNNENGSS